MASKQKIPTIGLCSQKIPWLTKITSLPNRRMVGFVSSGFNHAGGLWLTWNGVGYMGPTSSWSFCRRVFVLIGKWGGRSSSPSDRLNLDGTAFRLHWKPLPAGESPDVTNLPPSDYALFLFNTVKFYFSFLSYIIDEAGFIRELHEFYNDPAAKAASSRAWYAQYLIILAFGKAFLVHRNPTGSPPGHQYASRAMCVLPDLSGMDSEPLACIQALGLAAVYFQAIDMRKAAYHHVSPPCP